MPGMRELKKWLLAPFTWTLALVFLIEEAIWDWTAARMARLSALRLVRAVERRIAALPPYGALFAFSLPTLTLIPAKLLALHELEHGHWLLGSGILLAAKFVGMALFARIFNLTRPALMRLAWFVRLYNRVMYYRNRIHAYLDQWPAYQHMKQRLHRLAQRLQTLLKGSR